MHLDRLIVGVLTCHGFHRERRWDRRRRQDWAHGYGDWIVFSGVDVFGADIRFNSTLGHRLYFDPGELPHSESAVTGWMTMLKILQVGCLMIRQVTAVNWGYIGDAIPSFVTIAFIPFSYSVAYGLIA